MTLKQLLSRLAMSSDFDKVIITERLTVTNILTRYDIQQHDYHGYDNRKVGLFGYYNGNFEVSLLV